MSDDILEEARGLVPIIEHQARRPFVVEVTGTPKAGKSSSIRRVAGLFAFAGWNVRIVRESAEECPIKMKGHFFFNTWTTCTVIRELVDVVDSQHHLVILDRGLFDAEIWLRLQQKREQVTDQEAEAFRRFVELERWRTLQDKSIVMTVLPKTAMDREGIVAGQARRGSIMNEHSLADFNACIDEVNWPDADKRLDVFDVESLEQADVVTRLSRKILDAVRASVDPKVAVVSRAKVEAAFGAANARGWDEGGTWTRELLPHIQWVTRSEAEKSDEFVQVVAVGVPTEAVEPEEGAQATEDRRVFVFEREGRKARRYGSCKLWKATHLPESQPAPQEAVEERIKSDLHLANLNLQCNPLGLVWTRSDDRPEEARHLAIAYEILLTSPVVAAHLHDKTFRTKGRYMDPAKLAVHALANLENENDLELEPWSKVIIEQRWL